LELNPLPQFMGHTPHDWLRNIRVTMIKGATDSVLDEVIQGLQDQFKQLGHTILEEPQSPLDILITTAAENQPLDWHDALFFTARRRFQLDRAPLVFTLIHLTQYRFQELLDHFERAALAEEPVPSQYGFPGLAPMAYETLHEQGRRAGPILSLARLLQSQAKSIRIVLVVGNDHPHEAYFFDLVGSYPRIVFEQGDTFYQELVLRMVTAACTLELDKHEEVGEPIPLAVWKALSTPAAMRRAGHEFGHRKFFTSMVKVSNLVSVPRFNDAIASQYSEGCFATWEPALPGLVTTITGSIRPVEKDNLTDDELSVIVGVHQGLQGALVRRVDGKRNDNPSSEAVELIGLDEHLPAIELAPEWGLSPSWGSKSHKVPVVRSKLHGHRGVRSYDPAKVEHVFLNTPYYDYPVSCSTSAQAQAIISAFARSQALNHPEDPRYLVFTILPGHGLLIVEKWVAGKAPFQAIWEAIDSGTLAVESHVPQGRLIYTLNGEGFMVLHENA
jgi:hypothetical protein